MDERLTNLLGRRETLKKRLNGLPRGNTKQVGKKRKMIQKNLKEVSEKIQTIEMEKRVELINEKKRKKTLEEKKKSMEFLALSNAYEEPGTKTIREHIKDLRKGFLKGGIALVATFFIGFLLSEIIITSLIKFYNLSGNVVSLTPLEWISAQIRVSLAFTLILFIPLIVYAIFKFIRPTLSKKIIKNIRGHLVVSVILALVGLFSGILFFAKIMLSYLMSYTQVTALWGVVSFVSFVIAISVALAFILQIIIILPLLVKMNIISTESLKKSRIFVFFGILVISAFLTPPDIVSQFLITIPAYGSFELGILMTKLHGGVENDRNHRDISHISSNRASSLVR